MQDDPSNQHLVLLVGKPGHGRDALAELVRSQVKAMRLGCADTGLLALKAVRETQPCAVMVSGGLPDQEVIELVRQLKIQWPHTPCLVLVDRSDVQRDVLLAGADYVLPGGSSWGQILPVVQRMVQ